MNRDPHAHPHVHDPRRYDPPASLGRLRFFALVGGVVGLVLTLLGFFVDPANLVRSYLVGVIYWITIPLGCLGLLMINHLTGGDWGVLGRRIFEAGAKTLPLFVVLFLPLLLFGLQSLYPWTLTGHHPVEDGHAETVEVEEEHAVLDHELPAAPGPMMVAAQPAVDQVPREVPEDPDEAAPDYDPAADPAPAAVDDPDAADEPISRPSGPAVDGTVVDAPVDTLEEDDEPPASSDGIAPGDFGDFGHGAGEAHAAGVGIEAYVETHRDFLEHKAPYLNIPFLWVRLALYFLVWFALTFLLTRLSSRQDVEPRPALTKRMQAISAPGLILLALTVSFLAYDYLMALYPTWFSTMYGVYFIGTMGLSALAFLILMGNFLRRTEPWREVFQVRIFHDYGKLLLAFVVLWAYFSISQFLIIWSGNLPDEIAWFLPRFKGGWLLVTTLLFLFHFGVPFVLLLSRDLKEKARLLGLVAAFLLVMRFVDLVWQVAPTIQALWDVKVGNMWWMALGTTLLVGGIWMFAFLALLHRRPLLPVNDPYLEEALVHGHAH